MFILANPPPFAELLVLPTRNAPTALEVATGLGTQTATTGTANGTETVTETHPAADEVPAETGTTVPQTGAVVAGAVTPAETGTATGTIEIGTLVVATGGMGIGAATETGNVIATGNVTTGETAAASEMMEIACQKRLTVMCVRSG